MICVLLFTMCVPEDKQTKQIKSYIENTYRVKVTDGIRRVFILNDYDCSDCVNSFSDFLKKYVNDKSSLLLVSSGGENLDVKAFEDLRKKNPNIVISHHANDDTTIFSGLGVIYFDEARVDTIISLCVVTMKEQLQFIDSMK